MTEHGWDLFEFQIFWSDPVEASGEPHLPYASVMVPDASMNSISPPVPRVIPTTAAQRRDWISRLQRSGLDFPSFARRHARVLSSFQRLHRQVGAASAGGSLWQAQGRVDAASVTLTDHHDAYGILINGSDGAPTTS